MENRQLISVIIPAHNEERVIVRCLSHLIEGIDFDLVEIIVVCNGCVDQTATLVRQGFKQVKVVENSIASKAKALNVGDDLASGFPRIYIDADVLVSGADVLILAEEMLNQQLLAASPVLNVDLSNRSWSIRQFYKIWCGLPYVVEGTIGSGIYALSEEGRRRFDRFPDIVADDGFIRSLFSPEERGVITGCFFVVFPPMNLTDLVRIKTRVKSGNYELKNTFPEMLREGRTRNKNVFFSMFRDLSLWPGLLVYFCVNLCTHVGGAYRFRFGNKHYWSRDDSSRF